MTTAIPAQDAQDDRAALKDFHARYSRLVDAQISLGDCRFFSIDDHADLTIGSNPDLYIDRDQLMLVLQQLAIHMRIGAAECTHAALVLSALRGTLNQPANATLTQAQMCYEGGHHYMAGVLTYPTKLRIQIVNDDYIVTPDGWKVNVEMTPTKPSKRRLVREQTPTGWRIAAEKAP